MKAKGTTAELLLLLLQIQMTTEELLLFLQMLLYVHINHKACQGRKAQDGHLDMSHSFLALSAELIMTWRLMSLDVGLTYWGQTVTNACVWFNVALRPQKPYGSLGRGAQGRPPRLSHSS